jgi:hypothetical protein
MARRPIRRDRATFRQGRLGFVDFGWRQAMSLSAKIVARLSWLLLNLALAERRGLPLAGPVGIIEDRVNSATSDRKSKKWARSRQIHVQVFYTLNAFGHCISSSSRRHT